ncbi:MAG: tetratricopeptide repeat protein [Myxococcales bacterium]|nr:tetratricopeptide repeat protein [Myxococcales bacterium]
MTAPAHAPAALWGRVDAWLAGADEDLEGLAEAFIDWVDGRHPDDLEALLDALRDRGAYPLSLQILAAAWQADVPDEVLGRVAQDRIGTILHGLGDRAGALEVARTMERRALEKGPAFAGDLGDLYLSMDLPEAAEPLVRAAAAALPGDLALRFNLGVIQKLAGDWAGCKASFEAVLRHHEDQAACWSLGIACTALRDWAGARAAWSALGFELPPGDGDIASPGEPVAIRLPTPRGSEVVWGVRLCPARAEVRSLPFVSGFAGFADVVLLDGVEAGQATYPDGETGPVLPALGVWLARGASVLVAEGVAPGSTAAAVVALEAAGWPVADWSPFSRDALSRVAVGVLPPRTEADARAALEAAAPWLERLGRHEVP